MGLRFPDVMVAEVAGADTWQEAWDRCRNPNLMVILISRSDSWLLSGEASAICDELIQPTLRAHWKARDARLDAKDLSRDEGWEEVSATRAAIWNAEIEACNRIRELVPKVPSIDGLTTTRVESAA
jgi:hypothetical protein